MTFWCHRLPSRQIKGDSPSSFTSVSLSSAAFASLSGLLMSCFARQNEASNAVTDQAAPSRQRARKSPSSSQSCDPDAPFGAFRYRAMASVILEPP
jgi:hypothetical protein